MSPETLAQTHTQIIDNKLALLQTMFKNVNVESEKQVNKLLNSLELDASGKVKKSAKNRRVVNQVVAMLRKKTNALRPVVFNQYQQGVEQVNQLSDSYIKWLSERR